MISAERETLGMELFGRKSFQDDVVETFAQALEPSTATMVRSPEATAANERFIAAQAERQTQAKYADDLAQAFTQLPEHSSRESRYASALLVSGAYLTAYSLTITEMKLLEVQMTLAIPDHARRQIEMDRSQAGYAMTQVPRRFVLAADHWREVAELEKLRRD